MEKSKTEKVKEITTINFSITKCPHRVYEDFVCFCKEETNDNYSMGLRDLLASRKTSIKEVVLYQNYMELKDEFEILKNRFDEVMEKINEAKPIKPKSFGNKKG